MKKINSTNMKKRSVIAIAFLFCTNLFAQTNPTAQSLPYTQGFGATTFTTIPAGCAAWIVNSSPIGSQTNAQNSTTNGDATITAATTIQTTGGCYGYATSSNGRFYMQTSSNATNGTSQLACAVNTSGWSSIKISYDIEMISANPRTIGTVLQYRIGTSGSWTNVTGGVYSHTSIDRSNGAVDNFNNLTLPQAAENNTVVQLRWATWRGSEAGNSSGIAIDNISVTASSSQTAGYFRSKQNGNWNDVTTWEASPDNSTWSNATATPNYTANTITIQNGDTVTITATDTVDQVVIDGTLTYADVTGSTPRINNGTGSDFIINGTFEDFSSNSIAWASSATWSMGSNGTIIRTRSTSSNNWRDKYDGGISTIPASANWILRKTSGDNPSLSSTGNMVYPNLIIENNTGTTWSTLSTPGFTGSASAPIIKGNLDIGGSGTGTVSFINDNTNTSPVLVNGNLTIKTGSTLRSYGTGFEIQGNLIVNGSIDYGTSNSKFVFSGTNNQTISGTGTISFLNVQLNKTNTSATVTLQNPASVTGAFTFTNGYLITTSTNLLTFNSSSSATGASNNSFVSGPVNKIGYTAFDFPTGKTSNFQPISKSAPSNNAAEYSAEYFHSNAGLGTAKDTTIDSVSTCEYWTLNNVGTAYTVNVTLGWNSQSCAIADGAGNMRLTKWNGTKWIDLGNSSSTIDIVTSSSSISSFGIFTLAQQKAYNCVTAIGINYGCTNNNLLIGTEMWFKFVAQSSNILIVFAGDTLTSASVYSGNCSSLNALVSDNTTELDSVFELSSTTFISGNQYYLKVTGKNATNFNICISKTLLSLCTPGLCQQVTNGTFENVYTGVGSSNYSPFLNGDVSCWIAAWGTPQIFTGVPHSGLNYAAMWNYRINSNPVSSIGEGILTKVNVLNTHKYTLTYWEKKDPISVNNVNNVFVMLAESTSSGLPISPLSTNWQTVPLIPISQQIDGPLFGNTNVSSTSWVQRSRTFTANHNYDQLYFYPQQSQNPIGGVDQAWLGIDDVTLVEVSSFATPSSQIICSGASTLIALNSIIIGETFTWTATQSGVVGATAGSGSIIAQILTATGANGGTATYTIMPSIGCDIIVVTITVNPLITVTVNSPTICTGETGSLIAYGANSYSWSTGIISTGANTAEASPQTTTTYTVTGTILNGCSNTAISMVTVNPLPPTPIILGNETVCIGTLTHYSISGYTFNPNYSYSVQLPFSPFPFPPVGTISAFNSSNGTFDVTWNSGGVIIVTITDNTTGCINDLGSLSVTVYPIPTVTVSSNIEVCDGTWIPSSTTFGTSYTWTNSNTAIGLVASGTGNVTGFTANNNTANPIAATITVTPIANGCTGTPASYTITVNPLPPAPCVTGGGFETIGTPNTYTITSFNNTYSYSISLNSPSAGTLGSLNTSTGTFDVTWNAPGTITITVSGLNGCTNGCSLTVTPNEPQCNIANLDYDILYGTGITIASNVFPSNFFVNGMITKNIRVDGTLVIDKSITFGNCNVIMMANAKIEVAPGQIFTINEKTHFYNCTDQMWDGIYVPNGATVKIQGYSFIEDALNAVVSQNGGYFEIVSSTFNRNLISVDVQAYSGTHPGIIENTIFTSRDIPSNALPSSNPDVGIFKANLSTYLAANLKAPYTNRKGFVGVNVENVTNIKIGRDAPMPLEASTNFVATNTFDAIMCGIKLKNSDATIYNNNFQNLLGYGGAYPCTFGSPCYFGAGVGVEATGNNVTGTNTITIGNSNNIYQPNTFNNTYRAISIQYYQTNYILNNSINNSNTGPFSPFITNYGNAGIKILPASNSIIDVEQNTVNNCVTGVWVDHGSTLALNSNLLFLDNNTVSADANGYCNNGIFVSDWASTVVPGSWEIYGNIINEAATGIFLQNVKKPTGAPVYNISDNVCQVRYAASGSINGIKALGCQGLNLTLNHIKYTPGSTAYLSGGNLSAYGIYLQNSSNMTVSCNEIDDAARSMVFSGNCISSTTAGYGITQNTMRQAQDGFVLLDGTAIIGQQGDATVASNNYWDMSTSPNFIAQTWNNATNGNTTSVLYVNNTTSAAQTTMPSAIYNFGNFPYIIGATGGIRSTTAPVSSACGQVRALSTVSGNNSFTASNSTIYTDILKSIVGDSTLLPVYNDESHWQRRKFAFDEIKNNTFLANDSVLNSFYLNRVHSKSNTPVLFKKTC